MNFANFQNQTLHRNDDVSVNKTPRERFSGEWETRQLAELGRFSKGRGIKRKDVSYEGLLCVRYGELYTQYHNYIEEVVSRVPPSVAATALPISTGDLLFAGSGETAEEIGRCAAYLGKEKAYAGGDIIVLTPANQNSTYLGHLMNHSIVAVQKARMAQGDAVVHISTNSLAQVQVELPPIAEQNAIAEVLSDVDGLIGALDALIAKKRAIKQATMQQLLTGKTRLPGFGGAWETKQIGDAVDLCSEKNKLGTDFPVLTCSKHLGFVDSLSYFKNQVFSNDLSSYKIIRRGQIGYPMNHVEEGSIGLQDLYEVALVSPIYIVCSPREDVNSYFLHRLLKLDSYRQEFAKATTSSIDRRGSLRWRAFSKIRVTLPPIDEQGAIASVLSDMDAEIVALAQRRDKTRAIKRGMMQQLLTGRVRLVKSE